MNAFSIGADPELFLKNSEGGLVSAIGLIGGSKDSPRPIPELGKGYGVQEDNVAVEFNIPPAQTQEEFQRTIKSTLLFLLREVEGKGLSFDTRSAALFPRTQLMHPKAMEFGCDPDFNAWKNGSPNPRPKAEDASLRSAGGHVHIGYKFKSKTHVFQFIKRCDLFLGVPSVLMDANGAQRRTLYGSRGAFRWKPYGCEYRTLSNFWIFNSDTVAWVYKNAKRALEDDLVDIDGEDATIYEAINNNNKEAASFLVRKYNIDGLYA